MEMPPPAARAKGHSPWVHSAPVSELVLLVGTARFPTTATRSRMSVALEPPASALAKMPPPVALMWSAPWVTPPVIVRSENRTVGLPVGSTVTTGPPPLTTVRRSPAPTRVSDFLIVTPPA